ncbi:MAG: hypothetical protein AAF570_05235, partial [Bacteroidota bacterium]
MAQYKAYCQNPDCGVEFIANRKDTKYCCKNCRNAHFRIRQRETEQAEALRRAREAPIREEIAALEKENQRLQGTIDEYRAIKSEKLNGFSKLYK